MTYPKRNSPGPVPMPLVPCFYLLFSKVGGGVEGNFAASGEGVGLFRKSLDLGMGVVLKFVFAGAEKGGTIG